MNKGELADQDIQHSILYVDDETKNLSGFKTVFRKNYKIYVASSAQEGIAIMEENPIHLLITDQRMPNMTGVEFLEKIIDKFPDPTRILLTGFSDIEAIIEAINKGKVYKYVTKPWQKEDLKATIDEALELYELREQNKQLIANLQKTNSELDRFIYSASHDLRAPVATIMGLLNLTSLENNLEKIREYLDLGKRSITKLDNLISDFVDFSKNYRLELQRDEIEFASLVYEVLDDFNFYYESQKINKIVDIQQNTSFISDKRRIYSILNNLISNAIRFHNLRQDFPEICISVSVDKEKASIKVTDNGQGIDQEHLEKVFDVFYRATTVRNGSGLGLFIVKETVEKLGGEISLQSEFQKNTTVYFTIPNMAD